MSDYNILDVIRDEVLGRADHVDKQTYVNRLSVCQKCPHLKVVIPLTGR